MKTNKVVKMQNDIHSTALVPDGAVIGNGVEIGPYCVLSDNTVLENNVCLKSHVVLEGHVSIGSDTTVHSFAVIGGAPQYRDYKGEPTEVIIGSNNLIREHVTIHRGTLLEDGKTIIGDNCMIMVGVHIAHDCKINNNVVIANNTQLGGHVKIDEYVNIGGMSAIHQFVRVGKRAMIGGNSGISGDIIPYGIVMGDSNSLGSLNTIGIKRMGVSREDLESVRNAFFVLFESDSKPFSQRLQDLIDENNKSKLVQDILTFIKSDSKRNLSHKKGL